MQSGFVVAWAVLFSPAPRKKAMNRSNWRRPTTCHWQMKTRRGGGDAACVIETHQSSPDVSMKFGRINSPVAALVRWTRHQTLEAPKQSARPANGGFGSTDGIRRGLDRDPLALRRKRYFLHLPPIDSRNGRNVANGVSATFGFRMARKVSSIQRPDGKGGPVGDFVDGVPSRESA